MSEPDAGIAALSVDRSAPMAEEGLRKPVRPAIAYGTIVVIGGGCYGSYYLRQLVRAREAGAITWLRVVIVDRDPACRVAGTPLPSGVEIACSPWAEFLEAFMGRGATGAASWADAATEGAVAAEGFLSRDAGRRDAIVPSPLMPHLLFDWLLARARSRFPERDIAVRPVGAPPPVPWQRASADGLAHYVSFAEWMCPINCIEPARCPVTRGPRDWTMPAALSAHVADQRAAGHILEGPLVFHCTHRAFGVGMIDVHDILVADRQVAERARQGPADFLVGTVSHCHGALGILSIGG